MLSCNARAVGAVGHCCAHHGFAWLAHHGAHVFKVNVDIAVFVDDLGNAADCIFQHIIGMGKGFVLRDFIAQNFEQLFIQHHNQRINIGFQLGQAQISIRHAAAAFKLKRLGHHANRQNTHFLGNAGNHRCSTGAGAATHAGCDEQHVGTVNRTANVVYRQLGSVTAFFRLAASAQAACAQLNSFVGAAPNECLRIGIGTDEFNALHATGDHVVNRVTATAADADHLDLCALVKFLDFNHFNAHGEPPVGLNCSG